MEDDHSKASVKSAREDNIVFIQPENSSQRISEIYSDQASIHSYHFPSLQDEISQNNNSLLLKFMNPDVKLEEEEDEDPNYHFHGKNELLANISEEQILNQLEALDFLGDCITSCNKVENYLMYSEYEENLNSDDYSFQSSEAHSEQVTAPVKKHHRHSPGGGLGNHSFSEPDLSKLFPRNTFHKHSDSGHPAKVKSCSGKHIPGSGPGKFFPVSGPGHKHPPAPMLPAIAEADSVDIEESLGIL